MVKNSVKYQFNEYLRAIIIYYIVIFFIYSFAFISSLFTLDSRGAFINVNGMEMTTAIFLLVLGLNSFKESFYMLIQNGISRKTIFFSRILSFFVLCLIMLFCDQVFILIAKQLTKINSQFVVSSFYDQLFGYPLANYNIYRVIQSMFYAITLYLTFTTCGYFITILYYRMSKMAKIIVSVGVPVSVTLIIPLLDTSLFHGKITMQLIQILSTVLGNPTNSILTFVLLTVFFSVLCWLLIRRATTKE